MSRFALISGGKVALVVDQAEIPTVAMDGLWVACDASVGHGARYLGDATFGAAVSWSDGDLPAEYWHVYPGPFKDRLGVDALAIAASAHPVCKAAQAMLADRLYIDLKGAQVAALLNMLIAANQPAADATFAGSGPITTGKRNTILNAPTSEVDRFIKGLPQPAV